MARRASAKIETDMFPFLSVLCSIIGVLMLFLLLIIATRVVAIEQPTVIAIAPPPPPPPPPPVKVQAGLNEQEYDRLKRTVAELTRLLGERREELAALRSAVIRADDMIASKEDEVLRPAGGEGKVIGVELDMPIPVDVQMVQGPKTSKKPIFVEVNADGYVVHEGRSTKGTAHAAAELDRNSSPLRQFLAGIERRSAKEYLVFLLHPNGIASWRKLRIYIRETYPHRDPELQRSGFSRIDTGVEPFTPGWLLIRQKSDAAGAN